MQLSQKSNHAIFDITPMVGSNCNSLFWPLIDVGAENVDPLRDSRVAEINQQNTQYIGYYKYPVQWSFGAYILKSPVGICTNTKGQFIVGDIADNTGTIKVFDSNGDFRNFFRASLKDTIIFDVATDQVDNLYVLRGKRYQLKYQVRIFDKDNKMYRCSPGDYLTPSRLTVMEGKSIKTFLCWVCVRIWSLWWMLLKFMIALCEGSFLSGVVTKSL